MAISNFTRIFQNIETLSTNMPWFHYDFSIFSHSKQGPKLGEIPAFSGRNYLTDRAQAASELQGEEHVAELGICRNVTMTRDIDVTS
jgi:hypothetical protein